MTITINNKTLELVEVPEGAYDFELPYYDCKNHITYKYGSGTEDFDIFRKTIPSGSYTILFKASEATEEQAREIVEGMIYLGYRDYSYKKEIDSEDFELCFKYNFYTATESLSSLIRSLGMEVEKTIILEKVK